MKRRRTLLLLALAAVAIALGLVLFSPRGPREPRYQGKRLSEWIQQAQDSSSYPGDYGSLMQRQAAGREAIQTIGSNALPWLLSEFARSEPKWGARFNSWADGRLPRWLRFDTGQNRIETAGIGLRYLGPEVAPALPALASYLGDSKRGGSAMLAMTGAGEMALPCLLKALASSNALTATHALYGLTHLAPTVEHALPPVLQTLQHTNKDMREWVLYFLTDFKARPDLVVPALTRALSDPDGYVKRLASVALAKRGDAARLALPELRQLMTNSDPILAAVARRAVQEIDPAARPPRRW